MTEHTAFDIAFARRDIANYKKLVNAWRKSTRHEKDELPTVNWFELVAKLEREYEENYFAENKIL